MKTRKLFTLGIMAGAVVLYSCGGSNTEQSEAQEVVTEASSNTPVDYTVDTASSVVKWKGVMLGIKDHTGTASFSNAKITLSGDQVVGGEFTVDLTDLTATDENYQPEQGYSKEKLIGHLSSPDFFDVANHPTASFKIDSVEGNTITGTMTIRGKSNTETITDVKVNRDGGKTVVTGNLVFNRKKYDVSFDMPVQDMVISDDIEIGVELSLN